MATRREFVGVLGAAAAAALTRPAWPLDRGTDRIKTVGVQLYTVRDALKADFDGTLRRVAGIGYKEVEFAGYMGRTPAQVRSSLDATRLKAPSAHFSLEDLQANWAATVAGAHTIGLEYLVVAWIDEDQRKTLDDYRRVAATFNRLGKEARAAGLRFAYHNHAFEFSRIDGQVPYDILLNETDPAQVEYEMDLYWVTDGGGNPLSYFARYPGRFPLVHVKDRTASGAMVDVGAGVIDWSAIFAHRKEAGIRHYFVEHDDPKEPFASLAASYSYLRDLRFTDA
jgi:sugar phosphate isomerase/epimerase